MRGHDEAMGARNNVFSHDTTFRLLEYFLSSGEASHSVFEMNNLSFGGSARESQIPPCGNISVVYDEITE